MTRLRIGNSHVPFEVNFCESSKFRTLAGLSGIGILDRGGAQDTPPASR
jgi:hypothetical protein